MMPPSEQNNEKLRALHQEKAGALPNSEPQQPLSLEDRKKRRFEEKMAQNKVYQRALIENKILRDSLEKVNKTAQTAVLALTELARGKIEVSRIDANAAAVLVFRVEDGKDLSDEFCDQMMKLLKLPLVVLPKSTTFEAVGDKVLENAGWTRKVEIVRAEGQALPE